MRVSQIDGCQNGTDHFHKTNVGFGARPIIIPAWNDTLAHINLILMKVNWQLSVRRKKKETELAVTSQEF